MKTNQEIIDEAVRKVRALRELTKTTGTITIRSQNMVLQSLPDELLVEVATALSK